MDVGLINFRGQHEPRMEKNMNVLELRKEIKALCLEIVSLNSTGFIWSFVKQLDAANILEEQTKRDVSHLAMAKNEFEELVAVFEYLQKIRN